MTSDTCDLCGLEPPEVECNACDIEACGTCAEGWLIGYTWTCDDCQREER